MAQSQSRTLIRNAAIVSMDARTGTIPKGDLLLEGEKIAAIGGSIDAADAVIVDGTDAIVLPGFVDAHRHVWQGAVPGLYVRENNADYFEHVLMRIGVVMTAEDTYLGNYLGGLAAIETGVTTVVDHSHVGYTPEKGEAAARGLIDSGIGGIFCYQISGSPTYGPGRTVRRKEAWAQVYGPADEWHFEHAVKLRSQLFASDNSLLRFAIALSPTELAPSTPEGLCAEIQRVRQQLAPGLITQHVFGFPASYSDGREGHFRVVSTLAAAKLLGPDYQLSHGSLLTADEFRALADAGSSVASTPLVELFVGPPIHLRARSFGIRSGIGIDTPISLSNNFFEEFRYSHLSAHQLARKDSAADSGFVPHTASHADALNSATLAAAESVGLGSVTGSLVKGKRADVVMLRPWGLGVPRGIDPLRTVVGYATVQDVDSVWVAGKRRKQDGKLLGVDVEALRIKAEKSRQTVGANARSITFTD